MDRKFLVFVVLLVLAIAANITAYQAEMKAGLEKVSVAQNPVVCNFLDSSSKDTLSMALEGETQNEDACLFVGCNGFF